MKEHQSLLSNLKTGDEVITSAGILGTISGMSDKVVTLEVSKNVQLKVLKSQVNQVVKGPIKDLQPNA
jgi:preprotein translocase subunit YajC